MKCPYCGGGASLSDSSIIYGGRSYGAVYLCENYPECDTYVGVHKGTKRPMGTLANAELRKLRKEAHGAMDWWWKHVKLTKAECYAKLANILHVPLKEAHIGMLNEAECKKVIETFGNR